MRIDQRGVFFSSTVDTSNQIFQFFKFQDEHNIGRKARRMYTQCVRVASWPGPVLVCVRLRPSTANGSCTSCITTQPVPKAGDVLQRFCSLIRLKAMVKSVAQPRSLQAALQPAWRVGA
jgi:hypothetical protein